jgi:hypothetical protein
MTVHFDEAFEFLIERLAAAQDSRGGSLARNDFADCELWIPNIVSAYWQPRTANFTFGDLEKEQFAPFYDAAWELCRIGVLRPGQFAPRGQATGGGLFSGDGFSITSFGRTWLREASQRPILDPSRLAQLFQSFTGRFGRGYAQRVAEAVATNRTANYLAACVMSGAAAESILLALAIAKVGDEAKVLAEYNTSGGRLRITKRITDGLAKPLADRFHAALEVLHYWRDDAGHGTATTIGEIDAHASLTQLLRLAHFASDHWGRLTT